MIWDVEACPPAPSFPCTYSEWKYQECTVTCGGGVQFGTRVLLTGSNCNGATAQLRNCNTDRCEGPTLGDCRWAPWGAWSSCSDSCTDRTGHGNQIRTRKIAIEVVGNGAPCKTADATEQQSCSKECPSKNKSLSHNLASILYQLSYLSKYSQSIVFGVHGPLGKCALWPAMVALRKEFGLMRCQHRTVEIVA